MTGKFITDILKIGDVELKTKIGLLDTLHRQHNGESLSIPLPPILPLPMIGIGQNSSVMKALVGSGAIRSHGYSIYHTDHAGMNIYLRLSFLSSKSSKLTAKLPKFSLDRTGRTLLQARRFR